MRVMEREREGGRERKSEREKGREKEKQTRVTLFVSSSP